jgi:transposase
MLSCIAVYSEYTRLAMTFLNFYDGKFMSIYLGVDISKKCFDTTVLISDKSVSKKFSNDNHGFKDLILWLDKHNIKDVHTCLEATGFYGEALAKFLFQRKYSVSIINPACIKHYAQRRLKRHKTDKIDSALIAEYCKIHQPALWKMPSADLKNYESSVVVLRI